MPCEAEDSPGNRPGTLREDQENRPEEKTELRQVNQFMDNARNHAGGMNESGGCDMRITEFMLYSSRFS